MTNDEWIAFQDNLLPDQKAAVEAARKHFFDDALKSYMQAFLEMLKRQEEHLEGLRGQTARYLGNQEMITDHLNRQDKRDTEHDRQFADFIGGVNATLAAFTTEFHARNEALDEWQRIVDERLVTFDRTRAESEQDRMRHTRLIDDLAREFRAFRGEARDFHQESDKDRKSLHTEIAEFRREANDRLDNLTDRVSRLESGD